MITDKSTIKSEAIFSNDRKHRTLWRRIWNPKLPIACVVMINPCLSDSLITDTTTELVIRNIAKLEEYGGVSIVNLFSILTNKLVFRSMENLNDYSNDTYIKQAAEEASVVILAWGKVSDTNAKIYHRAEQVIKLLEDQREKLRVISDGKRMGIHPLSPSVRGGWTLVDIDEWLKTSAELARKREEKEKIKKLLVEEAQTDAEEPPNEP